MSREPLDRYYTPRWAVDALLETFPGIRGDVALEPFKGQRGHISEALKGAFHRVVEGDLDEKVICDFFWDVITDPYPLDQPSPEWIVTNPPYLTKKMSVVVQKLLDITPNIALLLPLSFLEPSEDRKLFLVSNPPQHILVLPRITFERPNEDGSICLEKSSAFATYAWLIWTREVFENNISTQCWAGNRPKRSSLIAQMDRNVPV